MQDVVKGTIGMIQIDLDLVPGLKDYIENLATKELRTVEMQAVYMLKNLCGFCVAMSKPEKVEP